MAQICVWGTGKNAINFSFTTDDDIVAYIDNKPISETFELNGLQILTPDCASLLIQNYYTVVATSETVYHEIKVQLESIGKKEFEDFCYFKVYKKKMAIIYGNCHIIPLKEALLYSEEFNNDYGIYPLDLIQVLAASGNIQEYSKAFEYCDLFIHQCIRVDNKYGYNYSSEFLMNKVKKNCIILSIPNLYGMPKFYFPQIYADINNCKTNNHQLYSFRDKYIDEMFQEGKSIDYMIQKIMYDEFEDRAQIISRYDIFLQKLHQREDNLDIKISKWIYQSIEDYQLFYDYNHPTSIVFGYITKQILMCLGYKDIYIDYERLTMLDNYEVPVYGQVMNDFNMKWSNSYLRKFTKNSLTNTPITLREYVNQYIVWNYK